MAGEVTAVDAEAAGSRLSTRIALGLLSLGILIDLFALPHVVEGDGRLRFEALQAWLGGGAVPSLKYPLIGSLPSIPLLLLGRAIASPEWWAGRYNVVVFACGLAALYRLLHRRVAHDVLWTFLLLLGTTAMLPNALTEFGAETFSAMAVAVGLAAWSSGQWKSASVLLALGVANLPASLVGLVLALGWWAWREKRWRAVIPIALSIGLWLLENVVRRGSAMASGYEGDHGFQTALPYSGLPGFSYPTVFGVASLTLSFGKGLLFFTPGLFLVFARGVSALQRLRPLVTMWLLFVVGLVLVYGSWWAWYGGFTWGPRFLLFASIPASLLLAAQVRRPPAHLLPGTVVLLALMLSLWVAVDGAALGRFGQNSCSANHYALESFCWYVPEFSVLWTPFVFHATFDWRDSVIAAYDLGVVVYVAWPLLRGWAAAAASRLGETWNSRRTWRAWRF
ncbi:MAG: hypothetical protein ACHQ0J_11880 [Candidatus Dormibacterales bacterium]